MRIKMKLSFEAARRRVSLLELWVDAIHKTYVETRYNMVGGDRKVTTSRGALDQSILSESDILTGGSPSPRKGSIRGNAGFRCVIGAGGIIYSLLSGFAKL